MRRWVAAAAATAAIAVGLLLLVRGFSSLDESRVTPVQGPGEAFALQCPEHRPPPPGFRYSSRPPTSGPHLARLISNDRRALGTNELLHSLELGNIVLAYPGAQPPPGLARARRQIAGPFDAELEAAGQAVALGRRDDVRGLVALAWGRRLRADSPEDPALREFIEHWLGRGARATGRDCRPLG